jgi:hypothetical protein
MDIKQKRKYLKKDLKIQPNEHLSNTMNIPLVGYQLQLRCWMSMPE